MRVLSRAGLGHKNHIVGREQASGICWGWVYLTFNIFCYQARLMISFKWDPYKTAEAKATHTRIFPTMLIMPDELIFEFNQKIPNSLNHAPSFQYRNKNLRAEYTLPLYHKKVKHHCLYQTCRKQHTENNLPPIFAHYQTWDQVQELLSNTTCCVLFHGTKHP